MRWCKLNEEEKEFLSLKAENKILKQEHEFLQNLLKDSIQGYREQTAGYQYTVRFVISVCAIMLIAVILGLGYQYFKFAYMVQ